MTVGTEVTVGIDIGTSSVKAIAADGDGNVVAPRARPARRAACLRPSGSSTTPTSPGATVRVAALAELGDLDVSGVSVAAMVPSLTAVDAGGAPLAPGLLYGDERGRTGVECTARRRRVGRVPRVRALAARTRCPDAHGFWPAQAVANHALAGEAVLDTTTASLAHPLFDWVGVGRRPSPRELGIAPTQLPRLVPTGWKAGRIDGDGPALASGCIDAMAEQLVAGADQPGDVLVLLGHDAHRVGRRRRGRRGPGLRRPSRTPRRATSWSVARATRAACSATG